MIHEASASNTCDQKIESICYRIYYRIRNSSRPALRPYPGFITRIRLVSDSVRVPISRTSRQAHYSDLKERYFCICDSEQTKTPVQRAGESRTALGQTRPSCRKATPPVSSSDTTGRRAGGGHANVLCSAEPANCIRGLLGVQPRGPGRNSLPPEPHKTAFTHLDQGPCHTVPRDLVIRDHQAVDLDPGLRDQAARLRARRCQAELRQELG